jgi:hypothetical protein
MNRVDGGHIERGAEDEAVAGIMATSTVHL